MHVMYRYVYISAVLGGFCKFVNIFLSMELRMNLKHINFFLTLLLYYALVKLISKGYKTKPCDHYRNLCFANNLLLPNIYIFI